MDQAPQITHWLVAVARAAGLPGAEGLEISSDSGTQAAWDLVALTTGTSHEALARRVADHYRLDTAEMDFADPHAHRIVPVTLARKLGVAPLRYSDRVLVVATADPVSMEAERALARVAGRTVVFEVAPPALIENAIQHMYPAGEPTHEVEPLPAESKGGFHVLVVDDDADTRLLLRSVLERAEFRVDEAEDGTQALSKLSSGEGYDLVTLDLMMPGLSGLEVLQEIRSRVGLADLPVVVATASDDPQVEMQLFDAGADDFVVKPVDPPRFLLRIQAVLRRRVGHRVEGLFF